MQRRQFLQSTSFGVAATFLGFAPPGAAVTHVPILQENAMSDPTRPYEPLTSKNAALVLIDHQVGLMTGGSRLLDRRAEAQCRGASQSGQGLELADHCYHHRARQHVGADLP